MNKKNVKTWEDTRPRYILSQKTYYWAPASIGSEAAPCSFTLLYTIKTQPAQ